MNRQLESVIAGVRAATGAAGPLIAVGGRPFLDPPALAREIGADFTAVDFAPPAHRHDAPGLKRRPSACRLRAREEQLGH